MPSRTDRADVIDDARALAHGCPRPSPVREGVLERFGPRVAIEIACAFPPLSGMLQPHFDARTRGDGPPLVPSGRVEIERAVSDEFRAYLHRAAHASRERSADFVDRDGEPVTIPAHSARADLEFVRRS